MARKFEKNRSVTKQHVDGCFLGAITILIFSANCSLLGFTSQTVANKAEELKTGYQRQEISQPPATKAEELKTGYQPEDIPQTRARAPKEEEIKAGYQRHDIQYLQKICNNADDDTDSVNAKLKACRYLKLIKAKDDTDCNTVVGSYQDSGPFEASAEDLTLIAKHFATCGHYKKIFELLASIKFTDGSSPSLILLSLEDAGFPLEKEFVKYVTGETGTHFLPTEYASTAISNIGVWLVAKRHSSYCKEIRNALQGADNAAKEGSLRYFADRKCLAEGTSVAVELLLSPDKDQRIAACNILAEIGSSTTIKKVAALADTDPYSEINEELAQNGGEDRYAVKSYPVRDACRAATGKIRLRTE